MTPNGQELTDGDVNVVIYGGVILALLLVAIWYWFLKVKTDKKIDKSEIVKELYNEKERKNGQSKGGSHGHY